MQKFILLLACSEVLISCGTSPEQNALRTATFDSAFPASQTPAVIATVALETPSPPGGCEIVTGSQMEGIIGSLNKVQANPSIGEGIGSFEGCIYDGSEAFVILDYGPFDGIPAQAYYDQVIEQYDELRIETLSGLGEAASWIPQDEYTGKLFVLQTNIVLSVGVSGENARDKAVQITQIALGQIPSP